MQQQVSMYYFVFFSAASLMRKHAGQSRRRDAAALGTLSYRIIGPKARSQ
jgi:hypothetical protein